MINKKEEECGLIPKPIDSNFCTNNLSPLKNAFNYVLSQDGSITNFTNMIPGIQRKFSLKDYTEITLTAAQQTSFLDSQFNPIDCSCDNILMEAHYTVYFENFDSNFSTNFKITNVTVDVVYGKVIPDSCTSPIQLYRKSSWTFKQSIYSRENSGGPGFIPGSPIPIGVQDSNSLVSPYVNVTNGGM